MDYQGIVNGLNKIGSVLSVEINSDGSYGDICVEAANDTYLQSVNVKREEFVPGKPYYNYVPPTRNYEEMCFRCVISMLDYTMPGWRFTFFRLSLI